MNRLILYDWVPEPLANVHGDHWSKREQKLRRAREIVWAHAQQSRLMPVHGPARVTITLVFPVKRRRDPDNLHSRVKGILDGLVRGKWIDDDSLDTIDLVVRASVDPGQMRTVIDIESVARVPELARGGES